MPNFTVQPHEAATLRQIGVRASSLLRDYPGIMDFARAEMDVLLVHANGCPLRLTDLLLASDFNFMHDVLGIARHLDRETGRLGGHFLPRFAKRDA